MISASSLSPLYQQAYRIYLEDTDAGGIVYHANHLKLFERCRRDWLRSLGMQHYFYQSVSAEVIAKSNHQLTSALQFVVHEANIRYIKPILLDSLVTVTVHHANIKAASLVLDQRIYTRDGKNEKIVADDNLVLLSQATLTLACVTTGQKNGQTHVRPARLPAEFVQILTNS